MNWWHLSRPRSLPLLPTCSPVPSAVATCALRSRNEFSCCSSACANAHAARLKFGKGGHLANSLKTMQLFNCFPLAPGVTCNVLSSNFPESVRVRVSVECLGHCTYSYYFAGGIGTPQVCRQRRELCSAPAYPCSDEGGEFPLWLLSPAAQCNGAEAPADTETAKCLLVSLYGPGNLF